MGIKKMVWKKICKLLGDNTKICLSNSVAPMASYFELGDTFSTEIQGFRILSIVRIRNNEKHNVSETGLVSVLSWIGGEASVQLGTLEGINLN